MSGLFTQVEGGNVIVASHVEIISGFLQGKLGSDLEALVLAGSFGRGEGSVLKHDDGRIEPINDYDFLVILHDGVRVPPREVQAAWETECSQLTGMRWIDFAAICEDKLSRLSLTQANYDLKFGGQVVAGRADILDEIPAYPAEDLPQKEAQTLLTTRFWCFIGTEPQNLLNPDALLLPEKRRFVLQQLSKALIASGDSLLMLNGQYCVKYAEKAHRIAALSGIQSDDRCLMEWGYSYKLGGVSILPDGYEIPNLFLTTLNIHLNTWDCVRQKTPIFKGLFFARLFGGLRQLIRRGSVVGLRGVLLDRIQLRFLRLIRRNPQQQCVRRVDSVLLWIRCGEWVSSTAVYAANVAELRLK